MYQTDADKMQRKKARCELHKNATIYIEQILEATYEEATTVRPHISHL